MKSEKQGTKKKHMWSVVSIFGKAGKALEYDDFQVDFVNFNWELANHFLKGYLQRCMWRSMMNWLKY
jgi:hypothetical protein